jgi:hypothetical protein
LKLFSSSEGWLGILGIKTVSSTCYLVISLTSKNLFLYFIKIPLLPLQTPHGWSKFFRTIIGNPAFTFSFASRREKRAIDLIQVLYRIVEHWISFSNLLKDWNEICTVEGLRRARKPVKNNFVQGSDILIHGRKNDALWEILIGKFRSVDIRIDGINEGGNSILSTLELIWQRNIKGLISILAMANFKLPLCKVGLFFNIGIEIHVLMKVKNCNICPQVRSLYIGTNHLSLRTLKND